MDDPMENIFELHLCGLQQEFRRLQQENRILAQEVGDIKTLMKEATALTVHSDKLGEEVLINSIAVLDKEQNEDSQASVQNGAVPEGVQRKSSASAGWASLHSLSGAFAPEGDREDVQGTLSGVTDEALQEATDEGEARDAESELRRSHFDVDLIRSKAAEKQSACSRRFMLALDVVPGFVIVANSLVIGLSSDIMRGHVAWEILELAFLIFYALEIAIKVKIYGMRTYFGYRQLWNWFDLACLVFGIVDCATTWSVRVATTLNDDSKFSDVDLNSLMMIKIFRLARLARLVRLARHRVFYELRLMITGLVSGFRVLGWAIVLLCVIIYVFGLACTSFLGESREEFSDLPASMFTLFRCFTEGCDAYDGTPLPEHLRKQFGAWFMLAHIFTMVFATIGVFNLITAIFIDNVVSSQHARKLKLLADSGEKWEAELKDEVCDLMGVVGSFDLVTASLSHADKLEVLNKALEDLEGFNVTQERFQTWLEEPRFTSLLEDAEIEVPSARNLFAVLDADGGGCLSPNEILEGLLRLRGPVTKGDIIGISLKVQCILDNVMAMRTEMMQSPAMHKATLSHRKA
eukprot:gb/GFBE01027287.1/.p1 GENE.gb/GFBE01027287.1/~~gb/GFBE01027287.1/.p1  ORF type:complete len:577 (+),score=118.92 gb/GFBE01027287.1/:1-1731(+)